MKKFIALSVSFFLAFQSTAFGLATMPGSNNPDTRQNVFQMAEEIYHEKWGSLSVDFDPNHVLGRIPAGYDINVLSEERALEVPRKWESALVGDREIEEVWHDFAESYKTDRNGEVLPDSFTDLNDMLTAVEFLVYAGAFPGDILVKVKIKNYPFDVTENQKPFYFLEDIGAGTYTIVLHSEFVQLWEHLRSGDLWFEYIDEEHVSRMASVGWMLFFDILSRMQSDLRVSPFGEEHHAELFDSRYLLLKNSAWLWLLTSSSKENTPAYDNDKLLQRMQLFLEEGRIGSGYLPEYKDFFFSFIAPDEQKAIQETDMRRNLLQLGLFINAHFSRGETFLPEAQGTSPLPGLSQKQKAINDWVSSRLPFEMTPTYMTGKEGFTWGARFSENFFIASLGEERAESLTYMFAREYDLTREEVEALPVGERVFASGLVKAGEQKVGFNELGLRGQEVFGFDHLSEFGPRIPLTAKLVHSASPFSLQYHRFSEMIVPFEDGSAFLGLKESVTPEEFKEALESGEVHVIMNLVQLKKGQPYVLPPYTLHAFSDLKAYEVKAVDTEGNRVGTVSLYDQLKYIEDDESRQRVNDILRETGDDIDARISRLTQENLVREGKDFLTMSESKIQGILTELKDHGAFDAIDAANNLVFDPELKRGSPGTTRYEVMGRSEDYETGRYSVKPNEAIASFENSWGKPHIIYVAEGSVDIKTYDEKGEYEKVAELFQGDELFMPAYMGEYIIESKDELSTVFTQYTPPGDPEVLKDLQARIDAKLPFEVNAIYLTKKEGFTWGMPFQDNFFVNLMGEGRMEELRNRFANEYGMMPEEVDLMPVGERVIGAGQIQAGDEDRRLDHLGLRGKDVFGLTHLSRFGPKNPLTAKMLQSAVPLSVQYHRFSEMIVPLEDGYAYLGLKEDVTPKKYREALEQGTVHKIMNHVRLEKGQPYILPPYTLHAYDQVKVYEVKAVDAEGDKVGTVSHYDQLRYIGDEASRQRINKISKETEGDIDERILRLTREKLVRKGKDFLTMPETQIKNILQELEEKGSLKAINPQEELAFTPSIKRGQPGETRFEVMGRTENYETGRYTVLERESIVSYEDSRDKPHFLFVTEGNVRIKARNKEGEFRAVAVLSSGDELFMPAYMGDYIVEAHVRSAEVFTQYTPEGEPAMFRKVSEIKIPVDPLDEIAFMAEELYNETLFANVGYAVQAMHESRIVVFVPDELVGPVNEDIRKIKQKAEQTGGEIVVHSYQVGTLPSFLDAYKDGDFRKVLITDETTTKEYVEDLLRGIRTNLSPEEIADLFRDIKLVNADFAEVTDPDQLAVFQAKVLMISLLGSILEPGENNFLNVRALLEELLRTAMDPATIGTFISRLEQGDDKEASLEDISDRLRFFMMREAAVRWVEEMGLQLRMLREIWTYA